MVNSVAFYREDGALASASWDNKVELWAVRIGKLLRTYEDIDRLGRGSTSI